MPAPAAVKSDESGSKPQQPFNFSTMQTWHVHPDYATGSTEQVFQTLEKTFALQGEQITTGKLGATSRVTVGGQIYYVKLYLQTGKGLRRWIGRSRLRGEWENLQRFEQWKIPSAPLIAYGMEKSGLIFRRGAIVTKGVADTEDLAQLAKKKDPRLKDRQWSSAVSRQVAEAARRMHRHGFAHGDFKWRNILVTCKNPPQVFLIDCPDGRFWLPPFLQYRKNKDIACLDKVAKQVLTRTQRLRFFLDYMEKDKLDLKSKKQLRRIIRFFEGRE
jgi:tRNA A-37 threonylcarbamoyl transferase component Bud32